VVPDIIVHPAKIEKIKENEHAIIKESELKNHLRAELNENNKTKNTKFNQKIKKIDNDLQLLTGANILKALIIAKQGE
jgi:carboxyl-terminal processing protease